MRPSRVVGRRDVVLCVLIVFGRFPHHTHYEINVEELNIGVVSCAYDFG
jgi:hypothetical protein